MPEAFERWCFGDFVRWIQVPLTIFSIGIVLHTIIEVGRVGKGDTFRASRLVRDVLIVSLLGSYLLFRSVWPNKSHMSRARDLKIMVVLFSVMGCLNAFHTRYTFSSSRMIDLSWDIQHGDAPASDLAFDLGMVAFWSVFRANSFFAGCVTFSMFSWFLLAELVTSTGPVFWGRLVANALMAQLLVWVSISMERKSREVIREKKRLERMTAERERFFASQHATFAKIAHDLRTPLNGIINSADFMRNDLEGLNVSPEHPIGGYIDIMASAAEYMLLLTNNLLEVSRLTVKRQRKNSYDTDAALPIHPSSSLEFTPTCCWTRAKERRSDRLLHRACQEDKRGNATLSDVFSLHKDWMDLRTCMKKVFHLHVPTARLKKLAYQIPSYQGPCFIYADMVRLSQAANNLLSNALKMTEKGYVEVLVTSNPIQKQDGQPPPLDLVKHPSCDSESLKMYSIEIRIKDSGRGIPADKLQSLGNEFEQVQAKDAPIGTGLGLNIARQSNASVGTIFYLSRFSSAQDGCQGNGRRLQAEV